MTVEILGRACVAPSASNVQELLSILKEARCTVSSIPDDRWNHARFWHPAKGVPGKAYTFAAGVIDNVFEFDAELFGLSAREAANMDPQQRILLKTVWRAVEDARLSLSQLRAERVGVYIGASSLDSGNLQVEDPASGSPHFMTGNTLSIISNRISHIFGLNGPSMTIDTACSSSLVALHQARQALEDDQIDTAIVGGVNLLLHPFSFVGFSQARMLSPEGLCRAYAEEGEGYVRAEGAGAIVLQRSDRVKREGRRSRATVVATGMNSSGRTNGISLPSREAQAQLLRNVYDDHGIDRSQLAFVEGHGTGTKVGDPAELWAIGTVLAKGRAEPLPIGSIKSNIGHAEPASGILGLIKAMLSLENDIFPATLHAHELNSSVDFTDLNIDVNRELRRLERDGTRRLAGVNSFGFGGTNVHVVLSDPPQLDSDAGAAPDFEAPVVISAHTPSALRTLLESYQQRLLGSDKEAASRLLTADGDLMALRHRFATTAKSVDEFASAITSYLEQGGSSHSQVGETAGKVVKTAFFYAGNGSQWAGMGADAYRESKEFRSRFDTFSEMFVERAGLDLSILLQSADLELKLRDTRIAQAMLFAVQAALTDCLVARGVRPDTVFGHSVGEIAAAYAAGVLSAEDAATIVAVRSKHQHSLAGTGTMAAVVMSEAATVSFSERHGLSNIVVAGVNAHNSVTISGPVEEIKRFKALAQAERYVVHVLDIDYPFHHPIIDREKPTFLNEIPALSPSKGHTKFVSTVKGTVVDGRTLDSEYWWLNVREPIAFEPAVQFAIEDGCNLFLEISPRSILSNYVLETGKQASASITVLPTLTRPGMEPGIDPLQSIFLRSVAHGVNAGRRSAAGSTASIVAPPVPFENVQCRPATTSDSLNIFGRDNADGVYTLLGWRSDPNSANWKNHIDAQLFPDLAGHVVDGKSILPGSAFIEIALQAAQQYYGASDLEVTNLEIFRPLELRDNKLSELSTKISPETGVIEIASREYLSDDGWTLHATARSRKPTGPLTALEAVLDKTKVTHKIEADAAYRTARNFGLDYAACFQLLTRADVVDHKYIFVDLKQATTPAHPYLVYGLDPVSTDAAFHGLVALFGLLTGEADGAPYIPVRFGSVRFALSSKSVTSAVIEVQRFSPYSLKARINLLADDGTLVASLDDCRFRRTWLRQHHTLASASFHYQATNVGVGSVHPHNGRPASTDTLLSEVRNEELDEASLILDAAVHRAAFDIAQSLKGQGKLVTLSDLPGGRDFQCFLSNCLYGLVDIGMANLVEGGWEIGYSCDIPPVDDLIKQVNDEYPDRVAEAVLVNDAFLETMRLLEIGPLLGDDAVNPGFCSNATLDHVRHHTPLARVREKLIVGAVRNALADVHPGDGFTIVETGAVSPAFSQRLADMASEKNARLVILEPSDHLRRTLEIQFEANPSVSCFDPEQPVEIEHAHLVVSASGYAYGSLGRSKAVQSVLRTAAITGGRVVATEVASSAFADFVYGMTDGWFGESATPEFPIGRTSSETQWSDLLVNSGFPNPVFLHVESAGGALILIEAMPGDQSRDVSQPVRRDFDNIVELIADEGLVAGAAQSVKNTLHCSARNAQEEFRAFFAEKQAARGFMFTVKGRTSTSSAFQNDVLILSAFGEAVRAAANREEAVLPVRLLIVAPGGAPASCPVADPAASGIWTFARVLQNEYSELDIILVDPVDDQELRVGAVVALLDGKHADKEWVQDRDTGQLSAIRAVTGPMPNHQLKTTLFDGAAIRQTSAGRIDSIHWEETALEVPGAGEVSIEVSATGLNFRDVMWSMGLLPEEALEDGFAGATIGMEMSGTVIAVGTGVDDIAPGDVVMGIAPKALSTHVVVAREGVTKIPAGLDHVAAATIPVAFLTAYYSIVELGRIKKGETILIHGAAGGVGLAAIQIAKLFGAKVIATAGTIEKRQFLSVIGADHVFDSRSMSFVRDTLRATDDKGVDLVLNSLFAEAMERSFELLKPFGRFLELGKRDYYSDRKLALRPFRRNISYFGIDADQLLVNVPAVTRRIFTEVGTLFAERKLTALPYRAFGFDEIAPAFRLMQNAGHIGKIVIRPPIASQDMVLKRNNKRLELAEGVYLVVGGVGGFGLAAADWLAMRGATHIALCTRRGVADDETCAAMQNWGAAGIASSVHACDVCDEMQLENLLRELRSVGPLKGIVHAAMVLEDGLISNLNRGRNRAVIEVKADGASNLDRLTRSDELDIFLLFSSATTMIGNPGQANYVAANGYLEGLARSRRTAGLPALAIGFGAIADAGFLSRNTEVGDMLARKIGKTALKAKNALAFVEQIIVNDSGDIDAAAVMVAEIDWASAASLPITGTPLFSAIPRHSTNMGSSDGEQVDLAALVAGKPNEEAQGILHGFLAAEIASILKIAEDSIKPDKALKDIGLDSLMMMELGTGFQQKTGIDIPLSGMSDGATIGDVVKKLQDKLTAGAEMVLATSEEASVLAELTEKHVSQAQQRKPG
ncbi:SDR family NAD(P)-dependent oxidoreductase [Agrobacterium larrymoorei]|uniref:Phthiocerol/phenolphthiocerol synthesis type-I polyketide synthase C n=1 Tax=Agrobacterium larrymoorei TaxID=160699 RepID=A0ABU0UIC4_9HYPH|nr:SDR family NAD(P)-dependent oxidoreductase [Agrobacterium larrymoorei]MDQ1184613.1 phthiocerol/phenolphthiocerol synthesis type-I polyketide synthase C [Agrobacterium larrymoorei]